MPKEEKGKLGGLERRLGELEARVTALAGLREAYDARFTLITEKIGELRSMIIAQAKESADAKVKAEKALTSLEGIKPDEFKSYLMRRDAEIEGIKTRLSTFEDMVNSLRKEMKEYRETLAKFKGLETVIGMSDEARSNILRIQQIRDQVEVAADKVMTAFMEFQRRFKEVTNLEVRLSRLEDTIKPLQKAVGELEVSMKGLVSRADFDKLVGEIQHFRALAEDIKNYHREVSAEKSVIDGLREEFSRTLGNLERKNSTELKKLQQRLNVIERAVSRILKILLSSK